MDNSQTGRIIETDQLQNQRKQNQENDYFLMNSELFTSDDRNILNNLEAFQLQTKTKAHTYSLNIRILNKSIKQMQYFPIFMLHGHASSCVWAEWIKLAIPLYKEGYNIILMDLPGYGHSTADSKDRVNPKYYLADCAEMILSVLDAFKIQKVHCIGFCGGAANFLRTIAKYPQRFAQNHIFHNSVMGIIPENLEKVLKQNKQRVWISWCVDQDHTKQCVGYKYFAQKRKDKSQQIFLQDVNPQQLPCALLWSKQMGRHTSSVEVFDPSDQYVKYVLSFLNGGSPTSFSFSEGFQETDMSEGLIQAKQESLQDNNYYEEELQFALALSMSLNQETEGQ